MSKARRPRGTRDFLPEDMEIRNYALKILKEIATNYGYREIMTPTFEHVDLFTARSGDAIVNEMYIFEDKGGRTLVLRPEMTAPVARMYVESMARNYIHPIKVFYFTNVFRYERPQKGRYREFWQFGVECIGSCNLIADAEVIALAYQMLMSLGIKNMVVRVGHIDLVRKIIKHYIPQESMLVFLRAIDKNDSETAKRIIADHAPDLEHILHVFLNDYDLRNIEEIAHKIEGLDLDVWSEWKEMVEVLDYIKVAVPCLRVSLGTVRGLDYYTGVVFEIESPNLGSESQICGGGRYDLAPAVGYDQNLNATGFAIGFDRAILAIESPKIDDKRRGYYVIPMDTKYSKIAFEVAQYIRGAGIRCECELMGRRVSKALHYANKRNYRYAIFIGEDEVKSGMYAVKDLETTSQRPMTLNEIISMQKSGA